MITVQCSTTVCWCTRQVSHTWTRASSRALTVELRMSSHFSPFQYSMQLPLSSCSSREGHHCFLPSGKKREHASRLRYSLSFWQSETIWRPPECPGVKKGNNSTEIAVHFCNSFQQLTLLFRDSRRQCSTALYAPTVLFQYVVFTCSAALYAPALLYCIHVQCRTACTSPIV